MTEKPNTTTQAIFNTERLLERAAETDHSAWASPVPQQMNSRRTAFCRTSRLPGRIGSVGKWLLAAVVLAPSMACGQIIPPTGSDICIGGFTGAICGPPDLVYAEVAKRDAKQKPDPFAFHSDASSLLGGATPSGTVVPLTLDSTGAMYSVPHPSRRYTLVIRDPADQRRIHVVVPHLTKKDCEAQKAAILPDVKPAGTADYPLQIAVCYEIPQQ